MDDERPGGLYALRHEGQESGRKRLHDGVGWFIVRGCNRIRIWVHAPWFAIQIRQTMCECSAEFGGRRSFLKEVFHGAYLPP